MNPIYPIVGGIIFGIIIAACYKRSSNDGITAHFSNVKFTPVECKEATMTINDQSVKSGQVLVIRVALEAFLNELRESGLGQDYHGEKICHAYVKSINELLPLLREQR